VTGVGGERHPVLLFLAIADIFGAGEFVVHFLYSRALADVPSSGVALLYRAFRHEPPDAYGYH
jgi:hypothetical protein